ncbi:MAG: multicopper oxidase domain-containing protein [Synechococcus sp. BS307-5m-G38]|nr:multicopper oxidase domain-containing protein [Synechococcus sp. BS307-5m-G38]
MPSTVSLSDFSVIGDYYLDLWGRGYDKSDYLKVLPHPDETVEYKSSWLEWQEGQKDYKSGIYTEVGPNGSYYSSWGPDDTLEVTLTISEANEILIDGLGKIVAGSTDNHSVYDDGFQLYNNSTQGPLLVADPGDTLKIKLINDLEVNETYKYFGSTNLHTHGLHVSPLGTGDNVLISIDPGETWETEIKIPDDHFVGPDWYHPHLHGATNVQIAKGLVGMLILQPSVEETSELDFFSPVHDPVHWFGIQTWGLNQRQRPASPNDPLNQDQGGGNYRIGTPIESYTDEFGTEVYTVSDADYIGYNYYPGELLYNPLYPSPMAEGYQEASAAAQAMGQFIPTYGMGANGGAIENVIHTVNGQYNPTVPAEVGEWNLFGFLNQTVNTHQVIQLVREHEGELSLEEFQVVAVDGDVAGAASQVLEFVTETPVMAPGGRMTIQHNFTEPGDYYFLANATKEILGNDAPEVANTLKVPLPSGDTYNGINDGHLVWGAQVLASVEVAGDAIDEKPAGPIPWDYIVNEAIKVDAWIADSKQKLADGELKQRTFTWDANFSNAEQPVDDSDPSSFEGVYTINGRYFGHSPEEQTVLAMPMLGTTEEWTITNTSIGVGIPYAWGEWHPFHIHQNDFVVTHLNGLPVEEITSYPANQLADTVLLGGQYIDGTQTPDNPYGQAAALVFDPAVGGLSPIEGATPFEAKIMMQFLDYPGAYVNHCHILFHEDAGMMQAVKVILNTDSNYVAVDHAKGNVALRLGSTTDQDFKLKPYGNYGNKAFNIAIGDVNHGKFFDAGSVYGFEYLKDANPNGRNGVSDNIADIVTIRQKPSRDGNYTIKIFDGDALKQLSTGNYKLLTENAGGSPSTPIEGTNLSQLTPKAAASPATWGLTEYEGVTYIDTDEVNKAFTGQPAAAPINTGPEKIVIPEDADLSGNPIGQFVFSSSDGKDKIFAAEQAVSNININASPQVSVDITYPVTGGTGRFEGATGEIVGYERGNFDPSVPAGYVGHLENFSSLVTGLKEKKIGRKLANSSDVLLGTIEPFAGHHSETSTTSIAVGDIDGDGHADIIAGIGGPDMMPMVEIYSGADYSLMAKIMPFHNSKPTTINIAAGDINSDNFVDIIIGQGKGGHGLVEGFDGRKIFESRQADQVIDPMDGMAMANSTAMYKGKFQPYGEDYTGAIDVASGYILPRPDNNIPGQIIQTSYANFTTLAVNKKSSEENPSIQSFFYTGGGHVHATTVSEGDMEMNSMDHSSNSPNSDDMPLLAAALDPDQKLRSITGTFFDLGPTPDERGFGGLVAETKKNEQMLLYIDPNSLQASDTSIFDHETINLA